MGWIPVTYSPNSAEIPVGMMTISKIGVIIMSLLAAAIISKKHRQDHTETVQSNPGTRIDEKELGGHL